MSFVEALVCVSCGKEAKEPALWCATCGPVGTLDVRYDMKAARPQLDRDLRSLGPSIWRWRAILPVDIAGPRPPLEIGPTPLVRATPERKVGPLSRLIVKDEGRNPTASFKDRATAIVVARGLERSTKGILCASTGNAASSLAGIAAACGIKSVILVPKTAPRPKLAQLMIFGATVVPVDGTYDDAFDLSMAAAPVLGYDLRSTGVVPYCSEGKKTCALELAEQLDWKLPEYVAVSVGDGCIIGGLAKGFEDLVELGLIPRVPKLIGVQAEGSAALTETAKTFKVAGEGRNRKVTVGKIAEASGKTLADSISVSRPRDAIKALRGVASSGGSWVTVTDDEILEAMRLVARALGVFAEPAGATATAGLLKLARQGKIDAAAPCVAVSTGSGLKDAESAFKAAGAVPEPIAPKLEALEARLRSQKT